MPRDPRPRPLLDRRRFLGLAGAGTAAAATGGLLAGCAPDGPRPGAGSAAAADRLDDLIPRYIPFEGPAPDIPGVDGAPDAYTSFPRMIDAIGGPRGSGGSYTAMTPLWGPVPPGLGDNSHYDLMNREFGTTVEFNFQDGNTIIDKLNAVIAGGDVADVTMIPDWLVGLIPNFDRAADRLFADLTPLLAGDAVEPYPMLANLAGDAWKWGVFNERLQGVPWPSNPFAEWFLYRADLFAELDLPLPTTADEFLAVGEEINDPDGNRWAFGDFYRVMRQVFGAPREWRYAEGRLVHQVETPEFAASVEFLRRVYDAGLVHPDIAAGGTNNKELLNSGRILVDQDAVSAITEAYQAVLADDPGFRLALLPVFGHDGGAPDMHRNSPSEHCVFLRKDLAEDAQRELLTVLDYCAAPFGTEEYMNYRYGTEGEHYEFRDGAPQLTELGQQEVGNGYLFLSGRPSPIVESQYPDYVEPRAAWFNDAIRYSGEDPFQGIRIQRPDAYASVETPTTDKVMDIIRGRREVRELEDVVGEWRRDGGDEGRAFFEQVLQDHGRD